jgi:cytoskeletal protein RodZ
VSDLLPQYAELEGLDDDDLKARYDENASVGRHEHAGFILDELRRREASRRERWLVLLTLAILVLTIANVVVVVRAG